MVTSREWPGVRGDHHVHSDFSDDADSTMEQNIAAARTRGLTRLRLVDHVRRSSTWVPEFCARTDFLAATTGPELTILTGVEAKILDASGRLDLPPGLRTGPGPGRVDRVLIADHQYPGPDGPWTPSRVLAERAAGLTAAAILDTLVAATIAAIGTVENAQLAHLFSLLPKVGLTEADVLDEHLSALAQAAAGSGAWVEINEKWGCPGPRAMRAFAAAAVTLVASTDSHHHRDVGRYRRVAEIASSLRSETVGTAAAVAGGPR